MVPAVIHMGEARSPAAVTTIATEASDTQACIPAKAKEEHTQRIAWRQLKRRCACVRTVEKRPFIREVELGLDGLEGRVEFCHRARDDD